MAGQYLGYNYRLSSYWLSALFANAPTKLLQLIGIAKKNPEQDASGKTYMIIGIAKHICFMVAK